MAQALTKLEKYGCFMGIAGIDPSLLCLGSSPASQNTSGRIEIELQPHLAALRNASHANVRPGSESARVLVGARVRVQNRRWVSL